MGAVVRIRKADRYIFFALLVLGGQLATSIASGQSGSIISVPDLKSQTREIMEREYRNLNKDLKNSTQQFTLVTDSIQQLSRDVSALASEVRGLQGWVNGFTSLIDECEEDQASLYQQHYDGAPRTVINLYEQLLQRCRLRVERQMSEVAAIRSRISSALRASDSAQDIVTRLEPLLNSLNSEATKLRTQIKLLNDQLYGAEADGSTTSPVSPQAPAEEG